MKLCMAVTVLALYVKLGDFEGVSQNCSEDERSSPGSHRKCPHSLAFHYNLEGRSKL